MVDTVALNQSFVFSIEASDLNGLADIEGVFFRLYRPDGSLVLDTQNSLDFFLMHDDGNTEVFGDLVAGDGIYTFKNLFAQTAPIGMWRFEFQAQDRRNVLSNKIIHNIVVK